MNASNFQILWRFLALGLCWAGMAFSRQARADGPPSPRTFEVKTVKNVAYFEGRGADRLRHRCDVFSPKGGENCPVVVLVHGGVWMIGDKSCIGLYSAVGKFLARNGIVAVLPNYRLSPCVKHPEHIKDVARAFAWTVKNCRSFGGSPDTVFVAGHSAGGHLAALLATDETYLKAEGLQRSNIKGVIPICGVYRIPEINVSLDLDADGHKSGILAEVAPISALHINLPLPRLGLAHDEKRQMDWIVSPFSIMFGDDPEMRAAASPIAHVGPGLPPFLVLYAERELPTIAAMAEEFGKALKEKGCDVEVRKVPRRSHQNIVFKATTLDDPVAGAILDFIHKHTP